MDSMNNDFNFYNNSYYLEGLLVFLLKKIYISFNLLVKIKIKNEGKKGKKKTKIELDLKTVWSYVINK